MVCVHHGRNGERLIDRGSELAERLHCPLYVLNVTPEVSDRNPDEDMTHWQAACGRTGGTLIVKAHGKHKPSEVIAEFARQHRITQLIIGHPGLTRWQEIMQGSIVNELLHDLEEVDIHIVAVERIMEE